MAPPPRGCLSSGRGAARAFVARNGAALESTAGRRCPRRRCTIACDMNVDDSAARIVDACRNRFGRIDGLVNCAGATAGGDPLGLVRVGVANQLRAEILRDAAAHHGGAAAHARAAPRRRRDRRRQHRPSTQYVHAAGSAVGAALHVLNKGLADATAADGIRFHILNPGPTRTERLVGYAAMVAKQSAISVEQAEQQLVKDAPQKRIAEPEEMAGLIAWMLSDRFAAATGNSVTADGGWVKAAS